MEPGKRCMKSLRWMTSILSRKSNAPACNLPRPRGQAADAYGLPSACACARARSLRSTRGRALSRYSSKALQSGSPLLWKILRPDGRRPSSADAISAHSLVKILRTLPDGITELGCHPGEGNDLDTIYGDERAQELKTLCDPQIPMIIKSMEIELRSFGNLPVGYWRGPTVHV